MTPLSATLIATADAQDVEKRQYVALGRSLCPVCGMPLSTAAICPYHVQQGWDEGDEWSTANRVWCALLHRGVVPMRLPFDRFEWEEIP